MPSVPFFMKKAHCFAEKITPAFTTQPGKEIVIMKKALLLTAALAAAAMMSGCMAFMGQDILSPEEKVTGASAARVKDAIMSGCRNREWSCTEDSAGVIRAVHTTPKFQAVVDIPYSSSGFMINYVSSIGLGAKNGRIHLKYNHWVNNLRSDVEKDLLRQNGVTAVYVHPLDPLAADQQEAGDSGSEEE